MPRLKSTANQVLAAADGLGDATAARVRRLLARGGGPVSVEPYLGYGTRDALLVHGRVLADKGSPAPDKSHSLVENLVAAYRRFESDEVPHAKVRLTFNEQSLEVSADDEGYVRHRFEPGRPVTQGQWHEVTLGLVSPAPPDNAPEALARVLVPGSSARFGIISDIDDTVIETHVAEPLKMLVATLLKNAHQRVPFPGIAAFYRALQAGVSGNEGNPVFYLSNSPWNLYAVLVEFLRSNGLPEGPLLLRDFGDHMLFDSHRDGKEGRIRELMALYRDLRFILVGDSAEQDPEIYSSIVADAPDRVLAIYIRSVDPGAQRIAAIAELTARVARTDCELVLAADSLAAAVHAAGSGWISAEALATVEADMGRKWGD